MALVLTLALAQAPAQVPLVLPGLRVHVYAHEELAADTLRALARPSVVLWLDTRSNTPRDSTIAALARFADVYVRVRPPVSSAQARQWARVPRAGLWLAQADLEGEGLFRLGPRRVAVVVEGPLPDAARLAASRPVHIEWRPGAADVDLLAFAIFRHLPGKKLARLGGLLGHDGGCEAAFRPGLWMEMGVERLDTTPCGAAPRVRWTPDMSDEGLRRLYALHPAAELELHVGSDEQAAFAAAKLLTRLSATSP
ncbi:MAG: hypothetical protein ACOZIN_14030 [Myxococcota bacterium]